MRIKVAHKRAPIVGKLSPSEHWSNPKYHDGHSFEFDLSADGTSLGNVLATVCLTRDELARFVTMATRLLNNPEWLAEENKP